MVRLLTLQRIRPAPRWPRPDGAVFSVSVFSQAENLCSAHFVRRSGGTPHSLVCGADDLESSDGNEFLTIHRHKTVEGACKGSLCRRIAFRTIRIRAKLKKWVIPMPPSFWTSAKSGGTGVPPVFDQTTRARRPCPSPKPRVCKQRNVGLSCAPSVATSPPPTRGGRRRGRRAPAGMPRPRPVAPQPAPGNFSARSRVRSSPPSIRFPKAISKPCACWCGP